MLAVFREVEGVAAVVNEHVVTRGRVQVLHHVKFVVDAQFL